MLDTIAGDSGSGRQPSVVRAITRALVISIFGFSLFLGVLIVALLLNPSISQSGFAVEVRLTAKNFAKRVLVDLDVNSISGVMDLSLGLLVFVTFILIISLVFYAAKKVGITKADSRSGIIVLISGLPAAVLFLGFVAFDFFLDDHSLRDAVTASYVSPFRSLVVCLKLSMVILFLAFAAKLLIMTFRRGG